jgi:hypothetical protein
MGAWTDGGMDNYASLPACRKDNYIIFKKGGLLERNEGATKCDPSYPQVVGGDWRFDIDEKEVWIDGGPWTILELNTSTLRLQGFSFTGVVEWTYKK